MGLHTDEHNLLLDQLSETMNATEDLYIVDHNGNRELNKRITRARDSATKSKEMLAAHIRTTTGDDDKLANYDKYHKWIILLAGAFITSMGRHAYMYFM